MVIIEEVQDVTRIKFSSTDNENLFLILHIAPLNNENLNHFAAQQPNQKVK